MFGLRRKKLITSIFPVERRDDVKMHIVFPLMGLSRSGGDRVIVQIANGLVRNGHRVTFLLSRPRQDSSFPLNDLVSIKQSSGSRSIISETLWLIRNVPDDADIVVGTFYITAYPVAIATLFGRKMGCYFIQGYEPDFFVNNPSRKFPIFQRILARLSYALPLYKITISSWLKNILFEKTKECVEVVSDGVDTSVFFPTANIDSSPEVKTVMCLGKNDNNKGLKYLLEALSLLGGNVSVKLLVATQENELVIHSPVPTEVVNPADDKELATCYNRADLFVFPSLREGFGLPPLEAMACGTPVVSTDCGGVLDYAENGVNCLVVPPANSQSMADAIRKLLEDSDLAARLSVAGLQTSHLFTWDAMVLRLEVLWGDLCHLNRE